MKLLFQEKHRLLEILGDSSMVEISKLKRCQPGRNARQFGKFS